MILTIQYQNHPPPHNNDDIKYKIITWMPPTRQRKPVSGSEELDRRFRAEKPDHRSDLRLLRKKYLDSWPCWHQLHLCLEGSPVLCTEVQEIAGLRPSAPSAPRGSGGRTRSGFRRRRNFSVNFAKKNPPGEIVPSAWICSQVLRARTPLFLEEGSTTSQVWHTPGSNPKSGLSSSSWIFRFQR